MLTLSKLNSPKTALQRVKSSAAEVSGKSQGIARKKRTVETYDASAVILNGY